MKKKRNKITTPGVKDHWTYTPGVIMALLITFSLLAISFIFVPFVRADNMFSPNYHLQFGNINIGGRTTSSGNYTLDISLGQTAAQKFTSAGYLLKAGFQYIHILYPFEFELSDISLDLGTLIPNSPETEQLTATISNRGQGYEVKVKEDYELQLLSGADKIDDTVCNGSPNCTSTNAEIWNSTSAYGFGYNANGHDVSSDFINSTYYRPFSTSPVTFMSSSEVAKDRTSTVTVKVNIDGIQTAGTYQTVLRFIAVPKY